MCLLPVAPRTGRADRNVAGIRKALTHRRAPHGARGSKPTVPVEFDAAQPCRAPHGARGSKHQHLDARNARRVAPRTGRADRNFFPSSVCSSRVAPRTGRADRNLRKPLDVFPGLVAPRTGRADRNAQSVKNVAACESVAPRTGRADRNRRFSQAPTPSGRAPHGARGSKP